MSDRRREERKVILRRVELFWTSTDGERCSAGGVMEDRSISGMGIRTPVVLSVGTVVQVRVGNETYPATVARCVRAGLERFIGLRLGDVGEG